MTLPKLESFTDANGTLLTTHDANWKPARNNPGSCILTIQNNKVQQTGVAGTTAVFFWNGDVFANDQYAQAVVATVGVDSQGPAVRCDGTNNSNMYLADSTNGDRELNKYVANVQTNIYIDTGALANNDLQRLEVSGNVLVYKINGSAVNGAGTTDNSFASGFAGVQVDGKTTPSELDSWEGGNLISGLSAFAMSPAQQSEVGTCI